MVIYNRTKKLKIFYPSGSMFPISTEIKTVSIRKRLDDIYLRRTRIRFYINNAKFIDTCCTSSEKPIIINRLQKCVAKIEELAKTDNEDIIMTICDNGSFNFEKGE